MAMLGFMYRSTSRHPAMGYLKVTGLFLEDQFREIYSSA